MKTLILVLRSLIFNVVSFIGHVVFLTGVVWIVFIPQKNAIAVLRRGFHWAYRWERFMLGLDYVMTGTQNLPSSGTYIAAIKHQSIWETYKVQLWFNNPAVIMKHELRYVPLWGWYAIKVRAIFVKRGSGREALRSLRAGAQEAKKQGRVIVIFPQGTRVPYRQNAPYKRGVVELYDELKVPIVPIALNSGKFWSRRSFIKHPGTIEVQVLPPIQPGLAPNEALKKLEAVLETASNRL